MVLNLCLPHFKTTAHCNKLCADGCDVSNFLSGDPAVLRRGCRLEYFLRPPLHVTLHFQVKVELYRVDVRLLPCANASRRLEILTCSEVKPAKIPENDHKRGQFKLVGRCEINEDVLVCFRHPDFKFQASFPERPLDPPAHAKQEELWSRGSLSSVAQLRITVPYSGASSALGIKSLLVWGVPSYCCSPSELEQFKKAHFDSLQLNLSSYPNLSPVSTSATSSGPDSASSKPTIPEEFLDSLTQELMVMPMILPSGMVVDSSTLEEYEKQEAAWGRMPSDPFTGVPFTKDSKPLPNPFLKSRIDRLLLQTGQTGIRSKNRLLNKPLPSRLLCASVSQPYLPGVQSMRAETQTQHSVSTQGPKMPQKQTVNEEKNRSGLSTSQCRSFEDSQGHILGSFAGTSNGRRENIGQSNKRKYQSNLCQTSEHLDKFLSPLNKKPRPDESITLSTETNSHEVRLSQSLDQALSSALRGLPSYTSQSNLEPDTAGGQDRCGSCSCSLTIYSPSPVTYSLPCGHLLCRQCLQHEHASRSQRLPIACPTCQACVSPSTIIRVHH